MDVLAVLRMCGWQGTGFLMRMPILFWFRDVAFFIRSAVAIILLMETAHFALWTHWLISACVVGKEY